MDLYLAGVGSWLPPARTAAEAVRRGDCDEVTASRSEVASVTIDEEPTVPAEMAVRAARTALAQAGCPPSEVAVVLHAYLYDQGNELWSAASYVQRRTLGNDCPAIGVQQVSNGGMAAIHLAAGYLSGWGGRHALVTTADRFAAPGFDRWRSDPGTVYADGGTAVVLSTEGGFARLASLVLVGDSDLEGMHRRGSARGPGVHTGTRPVDLGTPKRHFVAERGNAAVLRQVVAGQQRAMTAALEQAGTELGEIDWFVLPHFGLRRLRLNYLNHLRVDAERTNWSFSRTVGHLGAGDQAASLTHLATSGRLRPGQRVLVMAVGAGFSWSCGVVEVLRELPSSRP
ncbi:ketoacyl-ACP synthase III family protein [Actinoplanes siamensis]|uniref:3-oxoacyl-[acyl-carrier-protein] synthase 3 n=1 Tax=Actinoplanes siamensis TaxID=1223317 RepID=A0A919N9L1_9ACTN|nr:ketoacyl-ACP synthase III family protein [Actinoplanes siamensis]GIF07069.1 3-oxoacyl-[acyl-carrier-protein] synthase 3 [Actinoplanes siamensis]